MVTFSDVMLQQGRALEWFTTAGMLVFAFTLSLPGDSLVSATAWRGFADFGVSEIGIAVPMATVGAFRIAVLAINGLWHRSPGFRMVGAAFGVFCFSTLSLMMLWPWLAHGVGPISTGVGIYALFAVADLCAVYRAGSDVAANRRFC